MRIWSENREARASRWSLNLRTNSDCTSNFMSLLRKHKRKEKYTERLFTSSFTSLTTNMFTSVADSFPLVWFWSFQWADICSEISEELLIVRREMDAIFFIFICFDRDSFWSIYRDFMWVSDRKLEESRTFDVELVSDSGDIERFLISFWDSDYHILEECSRKSPIRTLFFYFWIFNTDDKKGIVLFHMNSWKKRKRKFSFWTSDFDLLRANINGNTRRDRDGKFTNTRHKEKWKILVDFTEDFSSYTEAMCFVSCDNSFWSRQYKYSESIPRFSDFWTFYIDTLSRSTNSAKRRNIFCFTNIIQRDDKSMCFFLFVKVYNVVIFFQNTKDFSLHSRVWNLDFCKTSKIAVSDSREKIWDWIDNHKTRIKFYWKELPARFSNTEKFTCICTLTDTDTTEIKLTNVSTISSAFCTSVIETSRILYFFSMCMCMFSASLCTRWFHYESNSCHKQNK